MSTPKIKCLKYRPAPTKVERHSTPKSTAPNNGHSDYNDCVVKANKMQNATDRYFAREACSQQSLFSDARGTSLATPQAKPVNTLPTPLTSTQATNIHYVQPGNNANLELKVRFAYGKDTLTKTAQQAIDTFAKNFTGRSITIHAHASSNGASEANYTLSVARGRTITRALVQAFHKAGKTTPQLTMVAHGEAQASGTDRAQDRRVDVQGSDKVNFDPEPMIRAALKAHKTKHYLLDASGSMAHLWHEIDRDDFPKKAKLYSFGSVQGVQEGIAKIASGGSPIWSSLDTLVSKMKKTSITIITDGAASDATDIDQLIRKAYCAKVQISVVYTGSAIPHHNEAYLRKVATLTGGKFIIRTNFHSQRPF